MSDCVILYSTWPDAETAEAFAAEAVAARLAACVHIHAPAVSIYPWRGVMERTIETPMTLTTTVAAANRLKDMLIGRHPYDLPCVLAFAADPDGSSRPYVDWVTESVISG